MNYYALKLVEDDPFYDSYIDLGLEELIIMAQWTDAAMNVSSINLILQTKRQKSRPYEKQKG